jgi:hypothetical protein
MESTMDSNLKESLDPFICHIVQAAAAAVLYSPEHRQVAYHVSLALNQLKETMPDAGLLSLTVLDDELFTGGRPLAKGPLLDRFVKGLKASGIGQITIERGVTDADLNLLVRITAGKPCTIHSSENLHFGSLYVQEKTEEDFDPTAIIPTYADIPKDLLDGLRTTYEDCRTRKVLDLTKISRVVKGFVIAFRREANPFLALVPLREMDEYTFTHSIDVCILNLAQGMTLGFEGQLLHDTGVAAMLHDVGKKFVPLEILNKPGSLEEWEWEAIRLHTVRGAEYLLNTPGVPRLAVLSAFEHHLRYDLTGYPKVLRKWQINLCSQMTMVSDCFDALRTKRVYKDAMDFEKVAGQMLDIAGKNLNPTLTLNFLKMLKNMGER